MYCLTKTIINNLINLIAYGFYPASVSIPYNKNDNVIDKLINYFTPKKYSNEFLNIGAGARGLAMGSAQIASVGDATSGYWNPAGLAHIKDNPQLSLMHADYFAGIGKYDFGALAIPSKGRSKKSYGM
mgnify:CR=1 FL=1